MDKSPDAFRTISEAAEELDLPQHVLRFWETRFAHIKPLKRGGGRRYYRPDDVLLLKGIRHLLYDEGFTIKGVQRILKDQGVRRVIAAGEAVAGEQMPPTAEAPGGVPIAVPAGDEPTVAPKNPVLTADDTERLNDVLKTLLDCKRALDMAREGN